MPYEMCEYYLKNGAPRLYHQYYTDALIRYAVSGDDTRIFEALARDYFSMHKHWYQYDIRNMTAVSFILLKKGKYDMLDILMDEFSKVDSEGIVQENMNNDSYRLHKEVIRRYMNDISYGLFGEPMRGDQDKIFMMSPLYFAMIAGDLEKCAELIANESIDQPSLYIDSAIAFRDTDFLRLMLNSGERFHPGAIIANCDDPEARKYLCDNFSYYLFGYEYDGSPMTAAEFIRHSVAPGKMLRFASLYLGFAGPEHFDENFESLPKIGVVDEHDLHFYETLDTYALNNKINIRSILADEVLCIARHAAYIHRLPDYFTIDLSQLDEKSWFCEYMEADRMIDFLNNNKLIFDDECLAAAARELYGYDDERIINAMISKGHINKENAEGVFKYLSENKLHGAAKALEASGLIDNELPV